MHDLADQLFVHELAMRARADLRMLSTLHLGALQAAVRGSLKATMRELDDLLIRPWARRADGLVLIPCLDVVGLPWAVAPSLTGVPLTISRSLHAYAARTGTTDAPEHVHVSLGPQLERGPAEAEGVANAWPGVPVEVNAPSHGPGLVAALGRPGIVHVTAHGHHEPQSPLFSRVELDDGPLFAHELQAHGIQAEHVVLGACEVGIPTVRPGEEHLGLAASLLSLGAASVVGAVAPIPDDEAAEVLTAHHRHLAAGRPTDAALALAIAASSPAAAAFHCLGSQRTYTGVSP